MDKTRIVLAWLVLCQVIFTLYSQPTPASFKRYRCFNFSPEFLQRLQLTAPYILSHRGSRHFTAENTIRGFHTVLQMGTHILEMDVHRTKDNQLVVFHDDTLNRTTNIKDTEKKIPEYTYKELLQVDAAYELLPLRGSSSSDLKIPLFRDILREFWTSNSEKPADIYMNIEIKDNDNEAADLLLKELNYYPKSFVQDHIVVVSRHCPVLRYFRSISNFKISTGACEAESIQFFLVAQWKTFLRFLKVPEPWIEFASPTLPHLIFDGENKTAPCAFQLPIHTNGVPLDTSDVILEAHKRGMEIQYWVINNKELMSKLIFMGADAIITDRTDIAKQVWEESLKIRVTSTHDYNTRILKGKKYEYFIPKNAITDEHTCVTFICLLIQHIQITIAVVLVSILFISYQCLKICCRSKSKPKAKQQ